MAPEHHRYATEHGLLRLPYWFIDRRFDGAATGRKFGVFVNAFEWDGPAFFDVEVVSVGDVDVTPRRNQVIAAYQGYVAVCGWVAGNYTGSHAWQAIMGSYDPSQAGISRLLWFADWEPPDGDIRPNKLPLPFTPSDVFIVQELARPLPVYPRPLDVNFHRGSAETLVEPVQQHSLDMLSYMRGDGTLYEMKFVFADGNETQHRAQTQRDGQHTNVWYLTKGDERSAEFETLAHDNSFIYRGLDTSPGGRAMYCPWQDSRPFAAWCPRFMQLGDSFIGSGHYVQRYWKPSGTPIGSGSDPAVNRCELRAHFSNFTTAHGIAFTDVVEVVTKHEDGRDGEMFWFARGFGMVQWQAPTWYQHGGLSAASEIHAPGARPDNTCEAIENIERFRWQ